MASGLTPRVSIPKVSIIVPCYNAGAYLPETLSSVEAQTFCDFETIVVDDGSTDPATLALLDDWRWPDVTLIRQDNAGPSAARNTAIKAATGAYILPVDADDLIDPTYLATTVSVLDGEPDVGLVYTGTRLFGAQSGDWPLPEYDFPGILLHNMIPPTALFRRSFFELAGGYDESLRTGYEDWEYWVRLIAHGCQVRQLPDVLRSYRILPDSRHRSMRNDPAVIGPIRATIVRNNQAAYCENLDYLMTEYLRELSKLSDYSFRYAPLERLIEGHPRAYDALRRTKRTVAGAVASAKRTLRRGR